MSSSATFSPDRYVEPPTFFGRHRNAVTAATVGVTTAVLIVLAFPPFKMPALAYAMLVPGIFWAYLRPSLKLYVWTMFAAQAVGWTIVLGWLHHVTWAGLLLLGPLVGAWVHLDPDHVLSQARALDLAAIRGPLHGVPVAIKDIIATADAPTEYGSPIYRHHRPAWDAACVSALRAAGAIIFGKTVTTEFATSYAGKTVNPHDPTRTPGGSS